MDHSDAATDVDSRDGAVDVTLPTGSASLPDSSIAPSANNSVNISTSSSTAKSTPSCSSALSTVITHVNKLAGGRPLCGALWQEFPLDPLDFRALEQHFRGDWFWEEKLHCDYFSQLRKFVIRMHAPTHGLLVCQFVKLIESKLRGLCPQNPSIVESQFFNDIRNFSHSTHRSLSNTDTHGPDAQIRHIRARYPGLIVEVAYSQKSERLPALADDYIIGSVGQIRRVIALDVAYRSSKKATIKSWIPEIRRLPGTPRPVMAVSLDIDQDFRAASGENVECDSLEIKIEDIAPTSLVPQSIRGKSIRITQEDCYHCLQDAEKAAVGEVIFPDLPADCDTIPCAAHTGDNLDQDREAEFHGEE